MLETHGTKHIDLERIEGEIVARIRTAHELSDLSGNKRSKMKQNVRANALSELLGWFRKEFIK